MSRTLRQFISFLIGDFSWRPPHWLARPVRRLGTAIQSQPRRSAVIALLVVAFTGAGWRAYDWQQRQPKPVTLSVRVESPGVTKLEKELQPAALFIVFGGSVMKVENHAGVPVTSGIRMEPPVEGVWKWMSDSRLMFRPKIDWPAGQKYQVTLDRTLFPKHALLERYDVEARTPAFVATMRKIEFYTEPTEPAVKQVVATFEFTHRVDMVELEKHLHLAMIGGADVFKKGAPRFTLTAGLHQRIAYLRTSALVLPDPRTSCA